MVLVGAVGAAGAVTSADTAGVGVVVWGCSLGEFGEDSVFESVFGCGSIVVLHTVYVYSAHYRGLSRNSQG